jgi:type II restriction/modification system DNA methylase subunit YeeA
LKSILSPRSWREQHWIGDIQWAVQNGIYSRAEPILRPLETIECRDALIERDSDNNSKEAVWPRAEFIVGNPPFLGDKKMRGMLGNRYTETLRKAYAGRVSGSADLVTYWFEKARAQIAAGKTTRAGLVATNVVSRGANRRVLDRIAETTRIFEVWSDEEWVNEGAAVRVSLICFGNSSVSKLDGEVVSAIDSNLAERASPGSLTGTQIQQLKENAHYSFFGLCLAGKFKISEEIAERWLLSPNANHKPNSDVLRPIYNGSDITTKWARDWVIDFGTDITETEAALYELPFEHALRHVKPVRVGNNRASRATKWWRHGEARPGLR